MPPPVGSARAWFAAATAASTSASCASGTDPTTASVLAAIIDIREFDVGATHWPPMNRWLWSIVIVASPSAYVGYGRHIQVEVASTTLMR